MFDLKIEVYTPALELIGFLEVHKSVIWSENAFSAGKFSVESLITAESMTVLRPDNIIWIEGDTAGIIETILEESGPNGPYITASGPTLTGILDRRILWKLYNLKGTVPEIMNALVDDCCIHPTRGDAESRKIPGLVLLDEPAGGDTIQIQATGGTLLERLETLGETYGVAFGVRFNPAVPQMEFWTRWGKDRSIHQSDNNPVLYSTELDDVLSSEYTYNSQDYRNVALVAGEGEGGERVYVTVENDVEEDSDIPTPTPPEPPVTQQYTVTLLVDPEGGGTVSGGKTVAAGVSVTVTASPADDYAFAEWRENGVRVSGDRQYTFTVTANRTLTAVFAAAINTYTITAAVEPPGSGNVTGAGKYQEGATVNLKATANDGYAFTDWKDNGKTIHNAQDYTFTAEKDRDLVAEFEERKTSRLPAGYTELEYIQSSGTQYLDCGIKATATTRINMDVEPTAAGGATNKFFFDSSITSTTTKYVFRMIWNSSGIQGRMASYSTSFSYTTISPNNSARRMKIEMDAATKTASVDGAQTTFSSASFSDGMENLKLLSFSNSNTYKLSAKLYSCQIFDGNTKVRDFVPCTNPSGQVGLYDRVEGTFYANAGTGTFTAGPAV